MAIIPVGYGQANIVLGGAGVPSGAEITFGINVDGFAGDPTDAATAIAAAFVAEIIPEMTNRVGMDHVLVKFGPEDTGPSGTSGSPTLGPANVEVAPPNTAYLITKTTAFGGRAGKGRVFLPGVPESVVSQTGAISTGTVSALTAAFQAFDGLLVAADLPPYLLHGVGSPITSPSRITSWVCSSIAATQRRRMRR